MRAADLAAVGAAAAAGGFVNALAGGGTLITFPTLLALGIPPVSANVTNTISLVPGYLGAAVAQRRELAAQARRLAWLVPAALCGGLLGAILLLVSGDRVFTPLVPWLILAGAALVALQPRVRERLRRRAPQGASAADTDLRGTAAALAPALLTATYGGYFGAGGSVIMLGVLGLFLDDGLPRLNALKQVLALAVNVAAALLFATRAPVVWPAALAMAAGALFGGAVGGRMAGRLAPAPLRAAVVSIGVAVGLFYLVR